MFFLAHFEVTLDFSRSEFTCPKKHNNKLLCASKFTMAKDFRGTIYFAVDGTLCSAIRYQEKI